VPLVRKLLIRVVVPVLVAAAAIFVVVSSSSNGPDGERTAAASEPPALADPNGRAPKPPRKPNVVMIVMDEFPGDSLRGPNGHIDALRYPNFGSLARNATWFPNAFTRYDSTPKAVPLILDGKRPFAGEQPDTRDHKHSIFDLFGRQGYRIRESEEATAICPRRWCPHARTRRPGILGNLNRGRRERFDRFIDSIKPGSKPTFWMKHVLLPHMPYMFLPSGAQTRRGARDPIPGMNSPQGFGDAFLTRHNEQRYLLQLGFADHELGRLLNRLVKLRMYDNTMIVLVADHGIDFGGIGVKDRRKVNSRNIQEIGPVPLFIKPAGQRRGRIDGAYASTLDVTPTIADVLNFKLPYRADGVSAFSRTVERRRTVSLPTRDFSHTVRISARAYERRRRAVMRRRLRDYGSGLTGLYNHIGPNRELVGKLLTALRTTGPGTVRGSLVGAGEYANVRRRTLLVPAQVAGSLTGGKRGARRDLAVAVNGRIEAVARSFYLNGDRREHFAAMVPEDTLREGRNAVAVYEVGRHGKLLRLLARS
jgi:arylsulfatase A-like enzyme